MKGDAALPDLLIDYKFTDSKTYSINVEKFRKHEKDAWKVNKEGVQVAVFREHNRSIACIDWDILKDLLANQQTHLIDPAQIDETITG